MAGIAGSTAKKGAAGIFGLTLAPGWMISVAAVGFFLSLLWRRRSRFSA